MKKEEEKRTIFCGVTDYDGNPVKLSEDHKKRFIENMSNGGKNDVIFCEDNSIPMAMKAIAAIKTK